MESWIDAVSKPCAPAELRVRRATALAAFADKHGSEYGVRYVEARKASTYDMVVLEVEVDRPQDRKNDIRKREPIAVVFPRDDSYLTALALRADFPFTAHQNSVPEDVPISLCTDDRPWGEARLTWSPADCVRRIRAWLEKAARGELNNPAQPLEPLFYTAEYRLILPRKALEEAAAGKPVKLLGIFRAEEGSNVVLGMLDDGSKVSGEGKRLVILPILIPEQRMSGMHRLPSDFGGLTTMLNGFGIDLVQELRSKLVQWVDWSSAEFNSLSANLSICVFSMVVDKAADKTTFAARAFMTNTCAGDVGVALGCLLSGSTAETKGAKQYVAAVAPDRTKLAPEIPFSPLDVQLDFDRVLAADMAGRLPDTRRAVLIGAGALGSHLAMMLAREGAFSWTIVDNDVLLPHNLARHTLPHACLGMRKAPALARNITGLLKDGAAASSIVCDFLAPSAEGRAVLDEALKSADIVIDASASIAVERHLSDIAEAPARRMSAFFNPSGTAGILLAEGKDRDVTLRELEARYYHLLLTEPGLEGHLASVEGVRYSGSCRTLTNRIPESAAALLGALLADEVKRRVGVKDPGIVIWCREDAKGVNERRYKVEPPARQKIEDWTVTVDATVLERLHAERMARLPNETGGVLLGIVDFEGKAVHVVHALMAPADSEATPGGFERGVQGVEAEIKKACGTVLDQIRYCGEWHAHPKGASARPSIVDVDQMCWLSIGLVSEGCPAVMLIVGEEDETINVALARDVE